MSAPAGATSRRDRNSPATILIPAGSRRSARRTARRRPPRATVRRPRRAASRASSRACSSSARSRRSRAWRKSPRPLCSWPSRCALAAHVAGRSRPGRSRSRARPAPAAGARRPRVGSCDSYRKQYDCSAPRPTRPRSWCSCESPNRSASSITITEAFGTSTPTSITVVATSTPSSRRREPAHALGPVCGLHLAVHEVDRDLLQRPRGEARRLRLGSPRLDGDRALHERAHDVGLAAGLHLLDDPAVAVVALDSGTTRGAHRRAAGRQLVEHRHVEVAVQRQRQRARDRRRRHVQHVRRGARPPSASRWSTPNRCCSSTTATSSRPNSAYEQRVRADRDQRLARGDALPAGRRSSFAGTSPVSSRPRRRARSTSRSARRAGAARRAPRSAPSARACPPASSARSSAAQRDGGLAGADVALQQSLHRLRRARGRASISPARRCWRAGQARTAARRGRAGAARPALASGTAPAAASTARAVARAARAAAAAAPRRPAGARRPAARRGVARAVAARRARRGAAAGCSRHAQRRRQRVGDARRRAASASSARPRRTRVEMRADAW